MFGSEDGSVLEGQLYALDSDAGEELTFYLISEPPKGSVTLSPNGSFRFEPGADFQSLGEGDQSSVSFVFEVRDAQGNFSQSSVAINIAGVNDAPEVAQGVEGNTDQNSGQLSINLLEHASDVDAGDSLFVSRIQLQSGNEAGVSLSLSGNELVVDPQSYRFLAEGEQETLVYEYRVSDSQGAYVIQTAEIIIAGENDLPTVASAVVYQGDQNAASLSIDLLDGASDVDLSDTLNVVSLQLEAGDPQGITFNSQTNTLEVDSSAYAELAEGETETIEYRYMIDDGHGGQVEQTASVEIEGLNDAPTSESNQVTINEDEPYIFSLTDFPYSDIDNNDQLDYVQISTLPSEGLIFLNGQPILAGQDISREDIESGLLIFTPEDNAAGEDYSSFTFRVSDGDLLSTEQAFAIDVVPVADTPQLSVEGADASADPGIDYSISSLEDTPVALDIESLLEDNDGSETLSLSISGVPEGSTLTDGANSLVTDGSDIDLAGFQLDTLSLNPVENSNTDFDLTITATSTESENNDQASVSKVLHVDLIEVNDAPESADSSVTIDEDTPHIFAVADFAFTDVDTGSSLQSVKIVSLPDSGNLLFNGAAVTVEQEISRTDLITGRLKFEPAADENGNDDTSFQFMVGDGELYSDTQSFSFNVTPINDAPDVGQNITSAVVEDTATETVELLEHATDVDGDTLGIDDLTLESGNDIGVSVSGSQLIINPGSYDSLPENQIETLVYRFNITDGNGGQTEQTATIAITGTNDGAVISGVDTGTVTEGTASILEVSGVLNISDADTGEAGFVAETVTGTYGQLTVSSTGDWVYQANNAQSGIQSLGDGDTATDSLSVRSLDGTVHNIVITVAGLNDVAEITGASSASITEDIAVTAGDQLLASGQLNVTDVDNGEALFNSGAVNGSYGSLSIGSSGNWVYTADNTQTAIQSLGDGDQLTDTLTVTTVDGTSQDITITINGSNDVAQISGVNAGDVTEDAAAELVISGQLNVSDTDAGEDELEAETLSGVYGDIAIDAGGNWTYSADSDQTSIQELAKTGGDYQIGFDNVRMTATTTEQVAQEVVNTDQSDQITGGAGDDILTGGNDSDTFIWHAEDAGTAGTPAIDTITDFHVGQGGDVLDLSDILVDEENHQLDEYLHFNFSGGDTTVEISSQANGDVTQKVTLQGVDLSGLGASDSEIINNLLSDGNLQIDS